MTSTFLGKWRLAFQYGSDYNNFVVYRPDQMYLGVLVVYGGPPRRETNIAFIRSSDSKLCFQLNNGKYIKWDQPAPFRFADTLTEAANFSFPGLSDPPTSFHSEIQIAGTERFMVHLAGSVLAEPKGVGEGGFNIAQVTPSLVSLQTKGNGDGLDFAWVDLTGNTLDRVSLIGSDFSHCNLTNFKFLHCVMRRAILNNCISSGTDFSGSVLAGANLNQADLTGVVADPLPEFYAKPLQPPSPDNPRTTFFGSRLTQSLIGNDWSTLDLTGTTIVDLPSPLSSQSNPLYAKYSILTGFNQNNLSELLLPYAVFDNAMLDNVNLNGADLTNASLIQASMHGTVLSNATLKDANMTGAQLGSLGHLFALPAGYEEHLKVGPKVNDALRNQFAQHGITLSDTAALNTVATGRVWQLNDAGNKDIYTVRLEGDPSPVHTVFGQRVSASLVNAYMPNAVLTGANLHGVVASGAQLYGSKARVDGGAILEKVEFNDANLSNLNLSQANLYGANLSGAYLVNAKFNKANLSPSADGVATNLSNANLQGADFTDAQLYGANLTNAAVAINVPTKVIAKQGGVYLFSLPYSDDPHALEEYTAELTAAATRFSLNPGGDSATLEKFLKALKINDLDPFKIPFLKHKPPITLSANAKIKIVEADSVWQIVDGAKNYTLWTDADEDGKTELFAAPSLTVTQAGFKRRNVTLRWQASASIDTAGAQWLLDNDSQNPQNFSTGYVKFIVKLNGNVLDVYGTALRILRLGDHNQEEFDTENCQVTILSQTNMNADTICPNGATLIVNQSRSGKSWDSLWLRAATPPRPPTCVPTDYNWCPPAKMNKE